MTLWSGNGIAADHAGPGMARSSPAEFHIRTEPDCDQAAPRSPPGARPGGRATPRLSHGVLPGAQRGTRMLQAFTDAITVSEHQEVDIFNPDTGEGYQRAPVMAQVRGGPECGRNGPRSFRACLRLMRFLCT